MAVSKLNFDTYVDTRSIVQELFGWSTENNYKVSLKNLLFKHVNQVRS